MSVETKVRAIQIGTKILASAVGGCAGYVANEIVENNLPEATSKLVKVARWVGTQAIGMCVARSAQTYFEDALRIEIVEEEPSTAYVNCTKIPNA